MVRCEASAVLLLWSEDGQAGKRRNTPWNKCAAGKRLRLRLRLRGRVGVGIGVCVCVRVVAQYVRVCERCEQRRKGRKGRAQRQI